MDYLDEDSPRAGLTGSEALGAEIEDPFGEAPNDLALNAMAHMIETSLLEMVNEKPRTIRPEVKDFVLL